jgi:hypothetical protein
MLKKIVFFCVITGIIGCVKSEYADSHVVREAGKTYIVDRTGERWDVTQAESLGFKPEKFQYGLGRDAFTPLDDTDLVDDYSGISRDLRIIGVDDGSQSQAYSVPRLSFHEISNSTLGSKPIAVGY